MRRSLRSALLYVVVVGVPLAAFMLLGTPEAALPSEWPEARASIDGGTYPAGAVIDIISGVLLLAWTTSLGALVWDLLKSGTTTRYERIDPVDSDSIEPDEPWALEDPSTPDEQISDDYLGSIAPPDAMTPSGDPFESAYGLGTITATDSDPPEMRSPDVSDDAVPPPTVFEDGAPEPALFEDTMAAHTVFEDGAPEPALFEDTMAAHTVFEDGAPEPALSEDMSARDTVSDAEIIGYSPGSASDEPPMIVPVRAYYFARGEDTLRSISAQFLQTPRRWEELRALNVASPGVAAAGADTVLPPGTALALPGDPLPWGKPDPVYLWTLAEKFLFTAWGREPTPEEVAPFWRGLTSGSQLEAGKFTRAEQLAAPEFVSREVTTPTPPPPPEHEPAVEYAPTPEPAPAPEYEPPLPPEPDTAYALPPEYEPALPPEPAPALPPEPDTAYALPPEPDTALPYAPAPPPEYEPTPEPEPAHAATPEYEPEPPPPPPTPEPAPPRPNTNHHPRPNTNPSPHPHHPRPNTNHHSHPNPAPPPGYQPPLPPGYEPAPPPGYQPPLPPGYEPAPPPGYQPPLPPGYEPAPPPGYQPPLPPGYEPALPPVPSEPGHVDLGPIEPEAPYVEVEAPAMPTFMPSLMGTEAAAPAVEAQAIASSNRTLAGTAIGDAMMLLQLSRIRRRGGRRDVVDPIEESLKQTARVETLNLIEAAMRHLRTVTVGRLREKPAVLAVRVGTYGFEVLLSRPVEAPEGWQTASLGHVLELPQGVTVEDLDTVGQGPSLCPALVPVGDTMEGPLLLNLEEIGCLIVSGPGAPSVNLLNAIVGTLGTSPLAGDLRVVAVGLDVPADLTGWERVHSISFDSPQLEELLSTAQAGSSGSLDILVVGPGNDLLIQRAGQVATAPGSRLAIVGATSSVASRWPWRIHVDETKTAVVHPLACTLLAAQASASLLASGSSAPVPAMDAPSGHPRLP